METMKAISIQHLTGDDCGQVWEQLERGIEMSGGASGEH
jgi:hypothetical protein